MAVNNMIEELSTLRVGWTKVNVDANCDVVYSTVSISTIVRNCGDHLIC